MSNLLRQNLAPTNFLICEVLQLGNPQLRQVAKPVAIHNSEGFSLSIAELQTLTQDLLDAMQAEGGIGIAPIL